MRKNNLNLNSGFTLVELTVVIAILSIIVALAVAVFLNIDNSAKETVDIANLKMLNQATAYYRSTLQDEDPFDTSSNNDYLIDLLVPDFINETPVPQQNDKIYNWEIDSEIWTMGEEGNGFSAEASFTTESSKLWKITSYDGNSGTELVIPYMINGEIITEIGHAAFDNIGNEWDALTSVVLPEGLTKLGALAFRGNDLTSITIPGSLSTVGILAFAENDLTEVNLNEGTSKIGEWAFAKNDITSIEIPTTVTQMDAYAFAYNDITEITIGSDVSIHANTFNRNSATGFNDFYDNNGQEAGTYIYIDGSWVKQ